MGGFITAQASEAIETAARSIVRVGDATLYLGDCELLLPLLGRMDAIVTDPPYGIGVAADGRFTGAEGYRWTAKQYDPVAWDDEGLTTTAWAMLREHSFNQVVFGHEHLSDVLGPAPRLLVWDKKAQNGWEHQIADCETAYCSVAGVARVFRHRWVGALRASEWGEERVHPTQKPVVVMAWCISHLPEDVQTICDPFMGSGTTGVAALHCGKKFIGIEREPQYFKEAVARLTKAAQHQSLFHPKSAEQDDLPWAV